MAMPVGPHRNLLTEKIAIDCEMLRSKIGQLLGRVSIVNYNGETIYDTFVCYPSAVILEKVEEYYKFSGIRLADLDPANGAQPFPEVQASLIELLSGRIVIGHGITPDITAISVDLSSHLRRLSGTLSLLTPIKFDIKLRDTQKYRGYVQYAAPGAHQGPSLKNLAREVLGRGIKQGRISSVEDAVATMEVYRNAEMEIEEEQGK